MEQLNAMIELLKAAIEAGQTVEITADLVTITRGPSTDGVVGQTGLQVEISSPNITTSV